MPTIPTPENVGETEKEKADRQRTRRLTEKRTLSRQSERQTMKRRKLGATYSKQQYE